MLINNNTYSTIAKLTNHIKNPNRCLGTLIEEIPTDVGRAKESYNRGGALELSERLRKDITGAIVWLFGIPAFNKIGTLFCEKALKIPMDFDYSNAKTGNDAIKNSVDFLINGKTSILKECGLEADVSEIKKYQNIFKDKDPNQLIKQIKRAKQITSLSALFINCALMGFIIPKINQKITQKKLDKEKLAKTSTINTSLDDFINKTKKNKELSFGSLGDVLNKAVYNVENNNRFRLVATDVPMITGRALTSRNMVEALEFVVMDGGSVYFYNFSTEHVENFLRKKANIPNINPIAAERIAKMDLGALEDAIKELEKNPTRIEEIFNDKQLIYDIYKESTYGKYGKINRFTKESDLDSISKNVFDFLKKIKKDCYKDGNLDLNSLKKTIKNINNKNAMFLASGLLVSIAGLAVIVPKITFWITKKITGKNTFSGITDYSDNKKS